MDTNIKILERDENREQGYRRAMVEVENAAMSHGGMYKVDHTQFESLKGPQNGKWIELEDMGCSTMEVEDDFEALKTWYFERLDFYRSFIESLIKFALDGHPLYRKDLYTIIACIDDLDQRATEAGWNCWEDEVVNGHVKVVDKTGYARINKEGWFGEADYYTLESKRERFQKMKDRNMLYLHKIGYLRQGKPNPAWGKEAVVSV